MSEERLNHEKRAAWMRDHLYSACVERDVEIARLRDVIAGMETRRVMDERAHAEAVGELLEIIDMHPADVASLLVFAEGR